MHNSLSIAFMHCLDLIMTRRQIWLAYSQTNMLRYFPAN